MLKKTIARVFLSAVVALSLVGVPTVAYADNFINYSIEIEDDTLLENAVLVSETDLITNARLITTKTYLLPDSTTVVDTLERSAIRPFSDTGSDSANRTRSHTTDFGTININLSASFKWYKEDGIQIVECTKYSASTNWSATAFPKISRSTWSTGSEGKVKAGATEAWVKYYFYQTTSPGNKFDGTFKIYCNDAGTISDNGNS